MSHRTRRMQSNNVLLPCYLDTALVREKTSHHQTRYASHSSLRRSVGRYWRYIREATHHSSLIIILCALPSPSQPCHKISLISIGERVIKSGWKVLLARACSYDICALLLFHVSCKLHYSYSANEVIVIYGQDVFGFSTYIFAACTCCV